IFCFVFRELKSAFARKHVCEQLAQKQQNESEMDDPDTRFLFRPFETGDVGREQVDQQQTAQKITSRKNRNPEGCALGRPIDEETAKELVLRLQQPDFHLGQRAGKNQDNSQAQANDREAERAKEANETREKSLTRAIVRWRCYRRRNPFPLRCCFLP